MSSKINAGHLYIYVFNFFINKASELVLLKQNIGVSGGDSTPPEISLLAPIYRRGGHINSIYYNENSKQSYAIHTY